MGHIWVLYGQKSLYGAHVGLEWDKCPDSAHMGPTYTCLPGCYIINRMIPLLGGATSLKHCVPDTCYDIPLLSCRLTDSSNLTFLILRQGVGTINSFISEFLK